MCNMDSYPDPAIVGKAFVKQYYTQMHKDPSQMHRFYLDQSCFVHGGAEMGSEEPVIGQKAIHEKIESLDLKQVHAKIKQVDSHSTLGNGIVIQVTGELSSGGRPMRAFVQTFVLAPETPKKYYVHNDIFRYQDEDLVSESETNEMPGEGDIPVVSEQPMDTGDYLGGQETKVDTFPDAVDIEPVSDEQPLTTEAADLGGAGGVVWDQYAEARTTTSHTTEVQQNGIPEEAESATTPQPQVASNQEYPVYEPTVDHVTSEPVADEVETEQFTPSEVESKSTGSTWASRLAGKPQATSQASASSSQGRPLNSTIVSGSQSLPQREREQRGQRRTDSGSSRPQQQIYGNKDFSKKTGGGGNIVGRDLPDSYQLFVGGLPPQTADSEIRNVFEGQGNILEVRVNPKNFAFVVFDGPEPVQKIMSMKENFQLNGKRLNIELKRSSAARFGGPRSGGDRDRMDHRDRDRPRMSGGGAGGTGGGGGASGGMGGKPRNKGKR